MSHEYFVNRRRVGSRIFHFGEYTTHCYGTLALSAAGNVIASFGNDREAFWRLDGAGLEFLHQDRFSVTSRLALVQDNPLLFHGASVGVNNRLYLREAIALEPSSLLEPNDLLRPTAIVNTVPKSGTYWLQKVLIELGFRPTDLHLGNDLVDDNRGLVRDPSIHRAPSLRRIPLSISVLRSLLPPGSISVGHIDDVAILEDLAAGGCFLLYVVRDLRAILWSLYRFKLAAVDPVDEQDRHWRTRETELERFMDFLIYQLQHDLIHIANCFRAFALLKDVPVFRYEDLRMGHISGDSEAYLQRHLRGCGGCEAFRAALVATRDQPTPTLSEALPESAAMPSEQRAEIRRLTDAVIAGSPLAEVNALFGYG